MSQLFLFNLRILTDRENRHVKGTGVISGQSESVPGWNQVVFPTNHSNLWPVCAVIGDQTRVWRISRPHSFCHKTFFETEHTGKPFPSSFRFIRCDKLNRYYGGKKRTHYLILTLSLHNKQQEPGSVMWWHRGDLHYGVGVIGDGPPYSPRVLGK